MKFRIIIFTVIVVAVLASLYFLREPESPKTIFEPTIYYYNNPQISLKNVKLKVIYFVPQNREADVDRNWKIYIGSALEKIKEFHEFQFLGFSNLNFDIYPQPVVGLKDNLFYDSENTNRGNPNALNMIEDEMQKRIFDSAGDLFIDNFSDGKEYLINIYVYEGVGASAAGEPNGSVLLSMDYLSRSDFRLLGVTTLYHEITHAFGMPDQYDYDSGEVYSNDIMGAGRRKALGYTYIEDETKEKMGL